MERGCVKSFGGVPTNGRQVEWNPRYDHMCYQLRKARNTLMRSVAIHGILGMPRLRTEFAISVLSLRRGANGARAMIPARGAAMGRKLSNLRFIRCSRIEPSPWPGLISGKDRSDQIHSVLLLAHAAVSLGRGWVQLVRGQKPRLLPCAIPEGQAWYDRVSQAKRRM